MDALRVEGLEVTLPGGHSILRNINLRLGPREVLGLTGSSGAGKTTLSSAVCGLLPEPTRCLAGKLRIQELELDPRRDDAWIGIRGRRIFPLFQDASSALNPRMTIGEQIAETVAAARQMGAAQAAKAAREALERVCLPARCAGNLPHALSGGMLQRVPLAMALAVGPAVLVADEPTTALDAIHKRAVLDLFSELRRAAGTALLLVSHDLAMLSSVADRVAVLAGGTIVEEGTPERILRYPRHPETVRLVRALTALESGRA